MGRRRRRATSQDDAAGELTEIARRLGERDPKRLRLLLELGRAYLSVYEAPQEDEASFRARLALVERRNVKASA